MILNRYFLKTIFSYTATISLIFVLIIVSSRSIQYLEQASRGEINPEIVFSVVLLRLPEFLELILPLSFFLSFVLTLGRLRSDSEFVIMEQNGFSLVKVYSLLLIPASLISILLIYFSLILSPSLDQKVKDLLEVKTLEDSFNALTPGEFHKLDDSYLLFAQGRQENFLSDIFLVERKSNSKDKKVLVAKKFMAPLPESSDLIFQSGFSYSEGENNQLISVGFRSMLLAGDRDLIAKDNSFSKQKDFSGSLIWSCSISLMVLITMFLALPMSQNLPRKGRYSKVLPSLLIFSIYAGLLLTFRGEEVINLTYLIFLHLFFLIVAFYLNYRMFLGGKI